MRDLPTAFFKTSIAESRTAPVHDNALLQSLPADELDALRLHLRTTTLAFGAVLHNAGDTVTRVYFPRTGLISLVVDVSPDYAIETALIGDDGAVGGSAALHRRPAMVKAVAQIETSALSIDAEHFRAFCANSPHLTAAISHHEQFLHAQAQQSAACNAAHSIEARLCRWLLRASDVCGSRLAVTQEALAIMLGVRRTSVSLTAHALQEAGIIRYRRGHVEITDLPRLKAASCECYEQLRFQYSRSRPDSAAPPILNVG